jgi:molybdopterin adenylyltransferase
MNEKIRAIIVTVSDTRTLENDLSGEVLIEKLAAVDAEIVDRLILPDEFETLRQTLFSLTETEANLILTTGGTGFSERDNTPEATEFVIERSTPGIPEAMRIGTLEKTKFAMLSRGVAGIRNNTLIVNLPGSPKGAAECFDVIGEILPHAINLIAGNTEHRD